MTTARKITVYGDNDLPTGTYWTADPKRYYASGAPSRYDGPVFALTVERWQATAGADVDPEGELDPAEVDARLAAHPGDTLSDTTYWTSREEAAHLAALLDEATPVAEDMHPAEWAVVAPCLRRSETEVAYRVTGADADMWRVAGTVVRVVG